MKVLILGGPSPAVIRESFKSGVSVLDMVKVLLVLLESHPSPAVRSNCRVSDMPVATFEGWLEASQNTCWRMSLAVSPFLFPSSWCALSPPVDAISLHPATLRFCCCSRLSVSPRATPFSCTRDVNQWRRGMGRTLAVSLVHLQYNLASKGSWQIRFIPELACDVKLNFWAAALAQLWQRASWQKANALLCAVRTHFSSLSVRRG